MIAERFVVLDREPKDTRLEVERFRLIVNEDARQLATE